MWGVGVRFVSPRTTRSPPRDTPLRSQRNKSMSLKYEPASEPLHISITVPRW